MTSVQVRYGATYGYQAPWKQPGVLSPQKSVRFEQGQTERGAGHVRIINLAARLFAPGKGALIRPPAPADLKWDGLPCLR